MGDPGANLVWQRGLRWVEARRGEFALPEGPVGPQMLAPLKAVGELARTCSVLLRDSVDPGPRERLGALLAWAWEICREGAVFYEILERRPSLLMAGSLYSIFDRQGLRHEPTRQVLAELGRGPVSPRRGAEPWKAPEATGIRLSDDAPAVLALGLAEGWKAMGIPCRWSVGDLVPRTILGKRPEGVLGVDDGYSVAHGVFFATAFGADPAGLDLEAKEWLRRRIPSILPVFLGIPNLDVFAELTFALACTGQPVDGEEWELALRRAQREDGSLPGPAERGLDQAAGEEGSGGGGPETTSFRRDYHVTLASILASFALSRSTS